MDGIGIQIDIGVDDFFFAGMTTGAVQEGVIEHQKQKPFGVAHPLRELTDIQEGFQRGAREQFFGAIMVAMGQPIPLHTSSQSP